MEQCFTDREGQRHKTVFTDHKFTEHQKTHLLNDDLRTWISTENSRLFAKRDSLLALFAAVHVVALQFIRREERRQTVAQRDCRSHKQTESNTRHKRFVFAKPQEQRIFWRLTSRPQQLSYFQLKMCSSGCQLSSITHPAHWTNSPAHWTNSLNQLWEPGWPP